MRFLNALVLLLAALMPSSALAADKNLVCFYDSASYLRLGNAFALA